jgi:Tol biopolymer transport system component
MRPSTSYKLRVAKRARLTAFSLSAFLIAVLMSGTVPAGATFPGANGKIAFESNRDGNFEIYVMNPDGTSQTRLTTNPADDRAATWSPDGRRIAFTSHRDGNWEIYVMNADGTGQTRLTNSPATEFSSAWSPDGRWIAFDSTRDGNFNIYVMRANGTGQTRITNHPADDAVPQWSPRGFRIAFQSTRDDPNWDIYSIGPFGTTRLTNHPCQDVDPHWAPSGAQLTWRRDCGFNGEIWVMNADGTGQTNLTNNSPPWFDSGGAFSPNGQLIAFDSDRPTGFEVNREVWVMNADGSGQTQLTFSPGSDGGSDWQPLVGDDDDDDDDD